MEYPHLCNPDASCRAPQRVGPPLDPESPAFQQTSFTYFNFCVSSKPSALHDEHIPFQLPNMPAASNPWANRQDCKLQSSNFFLHTEQRGSCRHFLHMCRKTASRFPQILHVRLIMLPPLCKVSSLRRPYHKPRQLSTSWLAGGRENWQSVFGIWKCASRSLKPSETLR